MVRLDDVPMWYLLDGIGHVMFSRCFCGECEARYRALCGLTGLEGEATPEVPARICSECRRRLGRPTLARIHTEDFGDDSDS